MINLFFSHFVSFWLSVLNTTLKPTKKASLTKKEMLPLVLLNQFILFLAASLIKPLILDCNNTFLYWFLNFLWKYPLMMITMNMLFGTFHYLNHRSKWLYKNIHYIHHRLVITDGMGAIYAHPLEHIFVNMLPIGVAILLLNADIYIAHIFIINISWSTVQSHAIYINKKSSKHGLHHYHKLCNFDNSPYILDRILGTFRKE